MVTSNVDAVYDSHVGNHARFVSNDVVNFVFSVSIRAVTILGSENCQSISLRILLSASQAFQGLVLSTEAVKHLQSFYQTNAPHITCHSCHYVQTKHRVTKLRSSQRTFLPVIFHPSLS